MLRKFVLFGLVGVINTLVDWGVFWVIGLVLPSAEQAVWLAKGASYSAGVVTSFVLNSRITFGPEYRAMKAQDSRSGRRAFMRFWVVALACMLINSATYELARGTSYLDLPALIVATATAYVAGFALNHRWTFGIRPDSPAG